MVAANNFDTTLFCVRQVATALVFPEKQEGFSISIIRLFKYLTSLNTTATCDMINNGRSPSREPDGWAEAMVEISPHLHNTTYIGIKRLVSWDLTL